MAKARVSAPAKSSASADAMPAVMGASALGTMASGAGGTTISTCTKDDNSFYCKFTKGFNIFKMVLFILAVIVILFMLYKMFSNKK